MLLGCGVDGESDLSPIKMILSGMVDLTLIEYTFKLDELPLCVA